MLLLTLVLAAAVPQRVDVLVYGGSAAGVMAAIQVAGMGRSVLLLEPGKHVGGMSVEGLGSSDIDNHAFKNSVAFGGLASDFYRRIGKRYGKDGPAYKFESSVAEAVFEEMLAEKKVPVVRGAWLRSVNKRGTRLTQVRTEDGRSYSAQVFIDGTIEGDLLAAAGVSTIIGREPNALYGETKNGIRGENTYRQFEIAIDPYVVPGDPKSGVIPTIQDEPFGTPGDGDKRIQGYCFRICFTKVQANAIPIDKPKDYKRGQYEIYLRYLHAGGKLFGPGANLPNGKTDVGSWHDLSANLYGMNHAYPGGNRATRARVYREHLAFTHGLAYFLANDPEVPESVRQRWQPWGLCKDEFTDNGGWPRQFYVRDARRMVSDYVITEHHTRRVDATPVADPVGMAYWPLDTHHVRRIVRDGRAYNEGFVFGGNDWGPFGISYRALVPRRAEATNLLTAAAPSSSHVAYGAIRLEWTFMVMGQSAGTAAVLALDESVAVQDLPYSSLRERLLADRQVLAIP